MRIRVTLWLSFVVLVLAVLVVGMNWPVAAQGGDIAPKTATPQPSPTNNGGSAKWTVNAMTFQSDYPKGFEFHLDVTSSGGKIVEAGVIWQHTPYVSRRARGKIDSDGKISAVWNATTDAVPQWVGVTYWWTLKDEAGNIFETPHQYDEYADNLRKWHRAESEDLIIFWQDGVPNEVGQMAIDAMKKQRPFYYQNWGKLLDYRPRAIIYANYDAFEWNPDFQVHSPNGTHLGGQTSANWGGTAQLYEAQFGVEDVAYGTITHEVGHLYQFASGSALSSNSACWFIEGDATYFESYQMYNYLGRVKQMAASNNLPSLQDGGPSCTGDNARDAYDIGYSFFKWLATTYGPDAHRKVWDLLSQGKSLGDALQTVTGKDFVAMETDFRAWLGMKNPEPPTPIPTEELLFPPSPTP